MKTFKSMYTPEQLELRMLAQRYRRLAYSARLRKDWNAVNKYSLKALNTSKEIVCWS